MNLPPSTQLRHYSRPFECPLWRSRSQRGEEFTRRRPTAPCQPGTRALLHHLAIVGFDGAPRVVAFTAATEVLTYIDSHAAVPPLPAETLTDAALLSVAALVRRYHRAVASFDPAGYEWPRPIPTPFRTGLVSHNDVHPANLVFREGEAVALIDFDWAGPGSAVWDVAAAARCWGHHRLPAGARSGTVQHLRRSVRADARRAQARGPGGCPQPRLDLRHRDRVRRRRTIRALPIIGAQSRRQRAEPGAGASAIGGICSRQCADRHPYPLGGWGTALRSSVPAIVS